MGGRGDNGEGTMKALSSLERAGVDTTLHYTTLHYTTLHYTTQHCTALHCTALHCTALHCTALHCTTVQYAKVSTMNYTAYDLTTLLYIYCSH